MKPKTEDHEHIVTVANLRLRNEEDQSTARRAGDFRGRPFSGGTRLYRALDALQLARLAFIRFLSGAGVCGWTLLLLDVTSTCRGYSRDHRPD